MLYILRLALCSGWDMGQREGMAFGYPSQLLTMRQLTAQGGTSTEKFI